MTKGFVMVSKSLVHEYEYEYEYDLFRVPHSAFRVFRGIQ